ncbi:hypothetical protein PBRA_008503 [Plasmodiophora brassicae]|nr:hypothetical protein PBRA_008503 [Plasmodiophora brassicae]
MSAEPALSVCATVRACLQPAAAAPVSRSRTLSGTSVAMVRIGHGSSARPAVRAQVRRVQPAGGRVTGHTTQKGQHEGGLGAPAALVAWGMGAVLTCLGAVPPSTDTCVIVPPVRASGCIGGVYHAYSERFPPQLEKHMSKDQFRDLIEEINDTLDVHFPCVLCMSYGMGCAPCTLGLSCIVPGQCVVEARNEVRRRLQWANAQSGGRMRWELVHTGLSSWIAVHVPADADPETGCPPSS